MRRRYAVLALAFLVRSAAAEAEKIGINVLLDRMPSEDVLAALDEHGTVLDVIPELNAVTLVAKESALDAIRSVDGVETAAPDAESELLGGLPFPDLSDGASHWGLDAINV